MTSHASDRCGKCVFHRTPKCRYFDKHDLIDDKTEACSEYYPLSNREKHGEENRKTVPRPAIVGSGFIAEQIWNRSDSPQYAVYSFETEKFSVQDEISLGEVDQKGLPIIYKPVDNSSLRKGLVTVPVKPSECSFADLFEKADDFAFRFFDPYDQQALAKLLVRISIASWWLDRFVANELWNVAGIGRFAPILPIRGPSGSGKNRFANVLRFLSYRPYFEMSTYRIPSLYRPLDLWGGTLILDEADFANTSEKSELIHFMNCRATGTPLSRQDPNNPTVTHAFSSFGLTILTQRRYFDDNATEGRSLPFYSEITDKKLPTVEPDEMIREGMELQNMLLYLRMARYRDVMIDKCAWFENVSDPRLNAALLPLLALATHEPTILHVLGQTVREVERIKIQQKACSDDGQLVNSLWEKVDDGLFELWNSPNFYFLASKEVETIGGVETANITPLTARLLSEELKWTPRHARQVITSLNLADRELPAFVKVNGKSYRVIFFSPERLEKRLREFVVDYEPRSLFKKTGHVTEVTQVTLDMHGASEGPEQSAVHDMRDFCDFRDQAYTQEIHQQVMDWIFMNRQEGNIIPEEKLRAFLKDLGLNPDDRIRIFKENGWLYDPGDNTLRYG